MDKYDQVILYNISEDCRVPLTKVAKSLRRSPQFVKYRLDQLKQSSIKSIPLILDYYALGYYEVTCLIRFPIIDPLAERTIIDSLFKLTETYKLISVTGSQNILCSFIVKNLNDVQQLKEQITTINQLELVFFTNTESTLFPRRYLGEEQPERIIMLSPKTERAESNPLLIDILRSMQKNPLSSLLEMSTQLNVTYEKVKYALQNTQLLLGNTLILGEQHVERAIVFIKLKNKKAFNAFCGFNKHVVEVNHLIGEYDAFVILESLHSIQNVVKQFMFEVKDSITDYMLLNSTQFYKYGWYGL